MPAALISVVPEGADVGVSNDGAPFDPASLDFSGGGAIGGLPVSQAYVNAEGSWAYTVKCPIERDGVPIAELYTEYTFDAIDQSLPQGLLRPAGRALPHGRRHGALRAEARGHGRARRGACESWRTSTGPTTSPIRSSSPWWRTVSQTARTSCSPIR